MSKEKSAVLVRDAESRTAPELRGIDRFLEAFLGESPLFGERHLRSEAGLGWAPAVDIRETDSDVIVYAALPGMTKQDVGVEVRENCLVIAGKLKGQGEDDDAWVRRELPRGEFYRAFTLPADVHSDRVKATMRDGMLEVRLPKTEAAKPRKVDIE